MTVSSTAQTTGETVAGAKYVVDLSKVFTDSDGHSLTYTLESTDLGEYTQIKNGILYFTERRLSFICRSACGFISEVILV